MKVVNILLVSLFLLSITGCSTSEQAVDEDGLDIENVTPDNDSTVQNKPDQYRNLVDFLHRLPGVYVAGPSNNPTVTIRGISSFSANIEPLYVIDGQAVGTSYIQVNNMINVRDIDHVRVLRGSEASIYGVRGGNGVIVIVTKS